MYNDTINQFIRKNIGGKYMNAIITIIIPFLFFIGLIIIFQTFIKRGDRIIKHSKEQFLKDEQEASFFRAHEIESSRYIVPDISKFPLMDESQIKTKEDEYAYTIQQEVLTKSHKAMAHFEEGNLELKKMYGAAHLEFIAQSEENYNSFLQSLQAWAKALVDADNKTAATQVLEQGIAIGLDLSSSFILLADLYKDSHNTQELLKLLQLTKESKNITMGKVVTYIENIIQNQ